MLVSPSYNTTPRAKRSPAARASFTQSTKVFRSHGSCGLDLHSGNGSGAELYNDIHFGAILVPEVEECGWRSQNG